MVTPDYFQVLGAPVVAGRLLAPTDHQAGASEAYPVAVISQQYAARMFGDAGHALGRTIVLGETTVTVVGVTPDSFAGIQTGVRTDIVVPTPDVGRIT